MELRGSGGLIMNLNRAVNYFEWIRICFVNIFWRILAASIVNTNIIR